MLHATISAPRAGRRLFAALACGLLAACSRSDDLLPPPQPDVGLQVVSRNPQPGVARSRLPDSVVVRAVDAQGRGVANVPVRFSLADGNGVFSPGLVHTDAEGYAASVWVLGTGAEQTATAAVQGVAPVRLNARLVPVTGPATSMLGMVGPYIDVAIRHVQELMPQNQALVPLLQDRLAMLRTRGLGSDILEGRRYTEGTVPSRLGPPLQVTATFPLEHMRAEAAQTIRLAEAAVPVVEAFVGTPFPTPQIEIWHGFILGHMGGGGTLYMEDRATYEARTPATRLPYDAIIVHELSHSWVGNESLAQFLELYGYNRLLTGSADPLAWPHTRGYVPGREVNEGVHALLDVYRLMGPEAMGAAYRIAIMDYPPYGQPLSARARQAFVDAAPAEARAAVAAKMARVQL